MRLLSTRCRAFSLVEMVVVLAAVALLATGLVATIMGRRDARLNAEQRSQCAGHFEQLGLAVTQYTQDYDEKYPPNSKIPSRGWVELLVPYCGRMIFHCPAAITPQPTGSNYFFNSRLHGITTSKIRNASWTIVAGDGDGTPSQTLAALPDAWRKQATSPAFRHDGGAYYSFADGHYKWVKPDKIDAGLTHGDAPTFAWK